MCEIPSGDVDAIDGVGVGRGLDIRRDLLVDRGVDGIVDDVNIETRGIGAVLVSRW
jgi:hypothetical protein